MFGPIEAEESGTYQIVFDPDDANLGALTAQVSLTSTLDVANGGLLGPFRALLAQLAE